MVTGDTSHSIHISMKFYSLNVSPGVLVGQVGVVRLKSMQEKVQQNLLSVVALQAYCSYTFDFGEPQKASWQFGVFVQKCFLTQLGQTEQQLSYVLQAAEDQDEESLGEQYRGTPPLRTKKKKQTHRYSHEIAEQVFIQSFIHSQGATRKVLKLEIGLRVVQTTHCRRRAQRTQIWTNRQVMFSKVRIVLNLRFFCGWTFLVRTFLMATIHHDWDREQQQIPSYCSIGPWVGAQKVDSKQGLT